MISSQSYKKIVNKVNNFSFEKQEIIIDGEKEKAFSVRKRRGIKKKLATEQRKFIPKEKPVEDAPHFGVF